LHRFNAVRSLFVNLFVLGLIHGFYLQFNGQYGNEHD
jgi:hypothetical protein